MGVLQKEIEELAPKNGKPYFDGVSQLSQKILKEDSIQEFQQCFENYYKFDNETQQEKSRELRAMQLVLAEIIREKRSDKQLVHWAATTKDAWVAFFHADRRIKCEFDNGDNFLHLLSRNKNIAFEKQKDWVLPVYQKNINIFFKENDSGQTPCDALKENPNYKAGKYFSIKRIYESYAEYNPVQSGLWKRNWNEILRLKSKEVLAAALNEDPALVLPYHENGKDKEKHLIDLLDQRYLDFFAEQLFVHLCDVMSRVGGNAGDKYTRIAEIEESLTEGYFNEHDPLDGLRNLVDRVQKNYVEVDQDVLKEAALNLKARLAINEHTENAAELRTKAVRATILSFTLVGIPIAIYYWHKFKKEREESPVHVFEMRASTYAKISTKLTFEKDGNVTIANNDAIFGNDDALKRVINIVENDGDEEYTTPLYLADEVKANSRLRIICADGEQTKRFEDKLDRLNLLDRLTVSTVL